MAWVCQTGGGTCTSEIKKIGALMNLIVDEL
jgi:hypothetical protein